MLLPEVAEGTGFEAGLNNTVGYLVEIKATPLLLSVGTREGMGPADQSCRTSMTKGKGSFSSTLYAFWFYFFWGGEVVARAKSGYEGMVK